MLSDGVSSLGFSQTSTQDRSRRPLTDRAQCAYADSGRRLTIVPAEEPDAATAVSHPYPTPGRGKLPRTVTCTLVRSAACFTARWSACSGAIRLSLAPGRKHFAWSNVAFRVKQLREHVRPLRATPYHRSRCPHLCSF
ncbi:hypothetical protein PCAR4_570229 [Paraburkholderia caribensis]|nr:hypothetical protein PCAR4_570229 [Paraburkholderia caribensis]